ncbi:formimidoylglutamase [Bacillus testis]|uniref:formimidoylglutamase n=1 Tax=Bacillus testis TaxID=1622072 RepID=UPI00067ED71E|nr:formimidoylglutamase [Bacillus testis]
MYKKPEMASWTGRVDDGLDPAAFRYHQRIRFIEKSVDDSEYTKTFCLVGFECDEGVRLNHGKAGAAIAPLYIKQALAKLPCHFGQDIGIVDAGSIACLNGQLEEAQKELAVFCSSIYSKKCIPVIIGGGHETVFGHYLAVRNAIGPDESLGIINLDAHFDLRPYHNGPSSGTMFNQILDQDPNCSYMAIGIQKHGNTPSLFHSAKEAGCTYILEEEIAHHDGLASCLEKMTEFSSKHTYVILTICMDVLNASSAPGVSAPSPFGLSPYTLRALVKHAVGFTNCCSFDICEVNPQTDESNRTVQLAAYILAEGLTSFKGHGFSGM